MVHTTLSTSGAHAVIGHSFFHLCCLRNKIHKAKKKKKKKKKKQSVGITERLERPVREWDVMCSIQCRVITKDVKMVSVATLFGTQHYKAALGHAYCLALNSKRQSLDNACSF